MDLYWFFKWFFYFVLRVFFSTVEVVGSEYVPKDGAVVFVGNHQNQFVDPMLILAHCKRSLGFLIAAKSMQRKIVGFFARALNSIPVTRALDVAKSGTGTITIKGKTISGKDTKFTTELEKGFSVYVSGMEEPMRVDDIKSDTEAILSAEFESINSKFKIVPKLDHSAVYSEVWKRLGEGGCIGIFPEGGSHDRSELLPLKAGVTLMALGAMEKYPNVPVYLVPCGLNYFSGHRFRSHVVVEFGKPFQIPPEFVDKYKQSKREACTQLLSHVERLMRSVTINAPDFDTLRGIHTIRKIYQPANMTLTSDQYLELNRRFALGFIKFKDQPEIQKLVATIKEYNGKLDTLGVKDHHVASVDNVGSTFTFFGFLVLRFCLLVIFVALACPGIIFNAPIGLLAKVISVQQAAKAKASSNVKIHGTDVIASYKLMIGLVATPALYTVYSIFVAYYFGILAGFTFLLVWPLFSYASVKVIEEGLQIARALQTLMRIRWAATELQNLRKERAELQSAIRTLVEELGPKLGPEIWDHRIVTKEDLASEEAKPVDDGSLIRWRKTSFKKKSQELKEKDTSLTGTSDELEDLQDVFN